MARGFEVGEMEVLGEGKYVSIRMINDQLDLIFEQEVPGRPSVRVAGKSMQDRRVDLRLLKAVLLNEDLRWEWPNPVSEYYPDMKQFLTQHYESIVSSLSEVNWEETLALADAKSVASVKFGIPSEREREPKSFVRILKKRILSMFHLHLK